MDSITSNRIVLYSAVGSQQKYVSYADSSTGEFKISLPSNTHNGMYRLVFDQKTMNYIDFLYLGKGFSMQFNPLMLDENPVFKNSDENNRYFMNLNKLGSMQQKIDSMQVLYFQSEDPAELNNLKVDYMAEQKLVTDYLANFNGTEESPIVKDLINANTRVQPIEPIRNPEEYLPFIKAHYFDAVDFNNPNLINSSILIDKVMDYVFYLTISRDINMQNELYQEAVSDVLQKIDNQELKAGFIQSLVQSFARDENTVLTDFLFEEYYDKLEPSFQNVAFKLSIQKDLKTAIGRKANDIVWEENDTIQKLSALKGYDYYIIVFWSSTCPHCLKELPKLYEYTKDKKNIKVIAIGMETEESQNAWKSETYYYPTFSHILGLGKWDNPIAIDYNIYSTPNYFILNTEKTIIDKPYEVVDLKVFFNGLK
jgi:thiol-disulfide isomerase/thioredoxin